MGNDGESDTRWSSAHNTTPPEEFWFVDLGQSQSFNRVRIQWEEAYATTYLVIWSSNGEDWYYSGEEEQRNSAGWAEHLVGPLNERYVGVIMTARAPQMANYSFFEFEVYGDVSSAGGEAATGVPIGVAVPGMAPALAPEE